MVIKLSDDWNGADFIALEFGSEHYLKVQLKGRWGFYKKYIDKNINICFCDEASKNWYLYPHDELCEIIMPQHENTDSWKTKGEYHCRTISNVYKDIFTPYILNSTNTNNNLKQKVPVQKSTVQYLNTNDELILEFDPSDENVFKQQLLETKQAQRTIFYKDKEPEKKIWKASKLTEESNLRGNIHSNNIFRQWKTLGIVKIKFQIIK